MQSIGTESKFDLEKRGYNGNKTPLAEMLQNLPGRPSPEPILSYQSLFHPSAEFPRFAPTYRWWEDEATTVLWAFKVPEIRQVIRYGLFRDENYARSSLLSRNADAIDTFLVALSEPYEHQVLANLSHMQRVEEILRRSSIPPFQPIPWGWFPLPPEHSLDARSIAAAIEAESQFQFSRIEFEEIVRASLGYNAVSVEWFLLQHTHLYIHLLDHLQTYPEEIPLYIDVEKLLRNRSPFAHRALVQCMATVQPEVTLDMPQSTNPGFEFIAGPIQRLFKDQPPSLTTILRIFSVLAIRFRKQYIHTSKINWHAPFNTEILFLEDCFNSTSPMDLARTLTGTDEIDFSSLSRQSIVADDVVVKRLLGNWHSLSVSVWECCSSLPDIMIPYLRECAQILFNKCNYHSLTAILHGMHRYRISTARSRGLNSTVGGGVVLDPILPPETTFLTISTQNYAAYRQHYREYPGIPFLLPHLRDHHQNGEGVLQPLIQYLQNEYMSKG
ncbi:Guanine-nucleotide dissociation stimulator CDC25 [Penicillium atrosanguineum]|uniref:Guanine-nucleotide dissociation stimulator CDC25 n=1 Tax=Penicillium atrosanguineum TaxID=1132637 RepID=A0A9W9KUD8_9EURO|nr:Guanine-nucleotide dissociation stimulator CDC25 [Penicillium atrosanguineum]KAJ5119933.1 Guanine-nucleotide dissociation stimulator CDC25 [Penicillium atrosanguineum]KAJ5299693.1 Guanine-nucleotide dissociation stimulator CDC25 [Penicillium atrosanguineum]